MIKLEIEKDYDALSSKAAKIFADCIKENPNGAFGFATGSSPIGLYKELVRMHKEDGLDFSGVSAFNLDEYHPLAQDSKHSYHYFMREHLFDHINIKNTYIPNGMATDADAECFDYQTKIKATGGIAMQILGIGTNGHIGFNEPSDCFEANTRLVPLAEATIKANSQHFDSPDDVPRHAITMGIKDIMMAKKIILIANGTSKASIIRDAFYGPITPLVPASALQLHPCVTVILDKEAASQLPAS